MKRRTLLRSGLGTLATGASNKALLGGLSLLSNVGAMGSTGSSDYKSLVMVFLNGGADTLGLIVPTGASEYASYQSIRQHLAVDRSELVTLGNDGYATPASCQSMANLFDAGKLSWVSNVGPLRQPTTKAMIEQNERIMPLFVGSHNSQQIMWQSGSVDPNSREGWGGRMLELLNQSAYPVTPNMSLDANQLFTSTLAKPTFTVNPDSVQNLAAIDPEPGPNRDVFFEMQKLQRNSILDAELAYRNRRTLESSAFLSSVVNNIGDSPAAYPDNENVEGDKLQRQLKMAARLIAAAPELGHTKQVIMVQMHAFDTHDDQDRVLPSLLRALFENLEAFQGDLEARGLDRHVVTFSQSDFGRTPTINANGTDHGWGGHNFVMGTPVRGGQIVGEVPEFNVRTEKMLYNLSIPDFSVEQYASNLAKWFGLTDSEIRDVFPNLYRFDDVDFGLF
jgi:uncharacterized protein (DUF1501 family)